MANCCDRCYCDREGGWSKKDALGVLMVALVMMGAAVEVKVMPCQEQRQVGALWTPLKRWVRPSKIGGHGVRYNGVRSCREGGWDKRKCSGCTYGDGHATV